ncbi:conserved hypothetical protein [Ixodes scapularis]|uniref:Ig-like domain-containing protein n=1 Tax=Ixodes scapularis TaxID=6945 RepID=B7Q4V1_IXOSC|nr:conserved hypothetical protein [Ixodes scapularis]|eukprot:XP_002401088.1 conserved hypothetical protein [Ixodes scapularis]
MQSQITAEAVSVDPRLLLMSGDVAGRPSPPPFERLPARQKRRLLCIPGGRRPRWNGQAGVPRASAIEITKLTVPRVVESGLEGPFDLDCQYRCNESDSKLVVKWFFNGEPQPFYQWIAEMQKPVVAERYEQSLDMDRSHAPGGADACNTHTWQLRLVKPTIDMSGKYRCEVLTLDDQDSAEASMMVFAPPSTFHFNYTKSSSDRATLLCEVDGAFPMPHLKMYRLLVDSEDDQAELVNVQLTTERKEGYYRAVMTSEVMDNALPQDEATVFLCSYSFKEIKYQRLKRLTYMPARLGPEEKQSGGSVNLGCGVRARLSLPFPDVREHRPSNLGPQKRREERVLRNSTPTS